MNQPINAADQEGAGPKVVTLEQSGDLLFSWLCTRCSTRAMKNMAQRLDYKYSFWAPGKAIRLQEEMTFLFECIAIKSAHDILEDETSFEAVIETFLAKTRTKIYRKQLKKKKFEARYRNRLETYFGLLRTDNPTMGVANRFVENLYPNQHTASNLEPSIRFSSIVGASELSLQQIFNKVIVDTSELPANSEARSPELDLWDKAGQTGEAAEQAKA